MTQEPLFLFIVGSIVFLLLIGIIGNWQLANRIRHLQQGLIHFSSRTTEWDRGTPPLEFIGSIIEDYKKQRLAGIEQINTQALIEKHFHQITIRVLGLFPVSAGGFDRFISFLNASMVMLGLLGTFIGLTMSLFGMQSILTGLTGQGDLTVNLIVSSISEPFDGMSVAFITSIFGISGSLLLSLFTSGLFGIYIGPNTSQLRAELLTECENFLDNHYLLYVELQKPKGSLDEILERLAAKIQQSFDQSVKAFGDSIITTTKKIDDSVIKINQMLDRQNKIILLYDQGSSQLVKFGQTMEKTVNTLVDNHKDTAAQMEQLSHQVGRLYEAVHTLGEKTVDSSRSLENIIRSSQQMLEDERKNNEKIISQFGERWTQISQSQKTLLDTIGTMQRQMEETVRSSMSHLQQFGQEMLSRNKDQWEDVRREWQQQFEQEKRLEQEVQQQLIRQIEQSFSKLDTTMQQNNRGVMQNLQQTNGELVRAIRQMEEIGQKNIESHRFLIERLPYLSRSAEEFSRSIENLERQQSDFLDRFRREILTMIGQSQERERKAYTPQEPNREIRELLREFEGIRVLLEREFRESHRNTSEIVALVEAIYETGRSTIRRAEPPLIDGRIRYDNGRAREEGYHR